MTSYDPIAAIYDPLMAPLERRHLRAWRKEAMASVHGEVLEVGVGTGANLDLYPPDVVVTGIEPSGAMLARARERAEKLGRDLTLVQTGVEQLPFEADRFDTVLSTLVFCAVADPELGLREIHRVLKPGGTLVMLEHTRTCRFCMDLLLKAVTPVTARLFGEYFDRDTAASVSGAGFELLENRLMGLSIFHLIRGRKRTG